MFELKDIQLSDKYWIDEILNKTQNMSCEYSFGNNFIWRDAYNVKVVKVNEFYVAALEEVNGLSFMYPAGVGDIKPVIEEIKEYCKINNFKCKLHSLSEKARVELETLFPDEFIISEDRNLADYIYLSEDLINLSGKKFHGKRNHITRFKENNWSFESINKSNINDCIKLQAEWCEQNNCIEDEGKQQERIALQYCFDYFDELGFLGGILRIDGKAVAYTIGERLNDETFVVHIEKALANIQGAYPTINQEFIKNMASEYKYINREEDLGIEGLRKAKLSYKPHILLTKYNAALK